MAWLRLLDLAFLASLALTFLALLLRGPRRWVKRLLTLVVLLFFARNWVLLGPGEAALSLLLIAAVFVASAAWSSTRWHAPADLRLERAADRPWPAHALTAVDRWTAELEARDARRLPDQNSSWRYGTQERRTTIRFLQARDRNWFAVISASENPKTKGRTFYTSLRDGRTLATADAMTDTALFRDPAYMIQRLPPTATCDEMIRAHERALDALPSALTDDVPAAYVAGRAAWVKRLVDSGQMRLADGWVSVHPRAIPLLIRRQLLGWLA